MAHPRILVVEDDPDLREALELWFDKRNCEVTFAANGDEGITILRSGEPVDLVLTDVMMPDLNGMELLRLVKSSVHLFTTKIVVMSSNTNPEFRKKAAELGAVEYLSKVDTAKTIVDKVLRILEPSLEPAPAEPTPQAVASEIRVAAGSLLSLIRVIGQVEGVPPAAQTAVAAAQKLAENIYECAAKTSFHRM
jgi:two-component system, chemotaxis family, chemotaxis protein CheY